MRHIEFLDAEIAEVERLIARYALSCSDARRLMSVPGVNVICAATFLAAIGDIRRFKTSRQLVGYLGLDPKVRQSRQLARQAGGSPSKAPRRPGGRWSRPRSARPPARAAARVLRADPRPPRPRDRDRRRRAQAHGAVLVPTHPRGAVRPPAAIADRQEAPAARAHRRREALRHQSRRDLVDQPGDARSRTSTRPPSRGVLRADGPRLAGTGTEQESGRERDTGARITVALEGQTSRGRLPSS